jgi:hypothetical protein
MAIDDSVDLRHFLKALVDSASDFLAVCASEEFDFARADVFSK